MNDDTAPATKADIRYLRTEVNAKFEMHTAEIKRYFDLAVETIRHDLLGANRDQIEVLKDRSANHERRIRGLEAAAGLAA